jgi:hypothetical protein
MLVEYLVANLPASEAEFWVSLLASWPGLS